MPFDSAICADYVRALTRILRKWYVTDVQSVLDRAVKFAVLQRKAAIQDYRLQPQEDGRNNDVTPNLKLDRRVRKLLAHYSGFSQGKPGFQITM